MMLKEMKVAGITVDPFTNTPIVILKDLDEKDVLPIWIGLLEASSIATALENIQTPRPMTHDLLKNVLDSLGAKVVKIEVNDLRDNTYFALIHMDVNGKRMVIDARPSDAIALALRVSASIFVEESVIKKSAKIDLTKKEDKIVVDASDWEDVLENLSPDDFGKYKM
ncbi:MAG TPA: bifunctional nuclease family protein [Syntrophorhabdales bacterium]|nr:bifunctional nuclease family protein [Syntrophorhabdales bacterium]